MQANQKSLTSEKQESILTGEEGSVIVIALIILMLLTMVGTSATNTSTVEIQVAGNERNYKKNFFRAEAAAMQASQSIQNAPNHTQTWMLDETFLHDASPSTKFDTIGNWTDRSASEPEFANTHSLVVYTGIAPWSSLDMTSPTQVRAFAVYGQRVAANERLIIETGFARRM